MESSTGSYGSAPREDATQALREAAAEFRRAYEQAMTRLTDATSQFADGLVDALTEARSAAERAEAAQRAAEATQSRMEQSYGSLSQLSEDLQERLSALAILARPLPGEPPAESPATEEEQPPPPTW